jgi:DNA repair exonuclease SbcCD nuclease subunit
MTKIIWRTDVHLSDRTPRSRTDVWRETVTGKLRQVGEIARAAGADAVIDGGDFFDIKSPGRNPHDLVREVADIHEQYPCPVYANVGNHDCVYGDYEYLPQQPLGVLFATGVFKRLYDEHELVIEKDGVKVRVVGVPYHGTSYDLSRLDVKKGDEDFLVMACHMLASPKGGTMFENEDIVAYGDLAELDADVWMFGHWHKDQGVTEIAPGKWVVNTGSMTRGALVQDDMDRKPCAVELRFGGACPSDTPLEIIRHDLEITPAVEVFDVEGRARAEMRESVMDDFVTKLKETLVLDGSEDSLGDAIRTAEVPDSVRERALVYLENA